MAKRRKNSNLKQRKLANNNRAIQRNNRPFWLPAVSYYFLTVAIGIIVFFLVWGILNEGGEDTPWIPAGVLSSLVLIGSVFLREVFLRKARNQHMIAQRQLDYTLSQIPESAKISKKQKKFTLQQNSYMLNQIQEKSEAAKVLKRLSDGHLEVFEICNEYLKVTHKELKRTDLNSPRFPAFRKGRKLVKKMHKYHLLTWAEVESTKYTLEAKNKITFVEKVETANKAKTVLDSALNYYPHDSNLKDSIEAVAEFISIVKMSNRIERAEKFAFQGKIDDALNQYNDILFFITSENLSKRDRNLLIEKVNNEIQSLELLNSEKNIDTSLTDIRETYND